MGKVHSIQLCTLRIYLRAECEIHQNQGIIQKIIASRCKRVPMTLHSAFFIRQVTRKENSEEMSRRHAYSGYHMKSSVF